MSTTWFTDRDLGLQFPAILERGGLTVERHRDHFAPDATDEEWLALVGRTGWVAITHNSRIRYTPNEKQAVLVHGVRLLVIIGQAPYAELAHSFVATRARIEAFLHRQEAPFNREDLSRGTSRAGQEPGRARPNRTVGSRMTLATHFRRPAPRPRFLDWRQYRLKWTRSRRGRARREATPRPSRRRPGGETRTAVTSSSRSWRPSSASWSLSSARCCLWPWCPPELEMVALRPRSPLTARRSPLSASDL